MSGERCRLGCLVDRCPNNQKRKKRNTKEVKYYPFPDEPITKEIWIKILSLVGYTKENNANICSIHFLESDFEVNEVGKFVLKINAVPSINLDLVLLGNEVVIKTIASTEDTINVGVLRNETHRLEIIHKHSEDTNLSYDFLNALKKSFSNTEYCKDYSLQLVSTCLDDNLLENVITAAKKNQISTLKNLKISTKGGTYNYKQRVYLYMHEEKNRTYAKIKTHCFGRCRLCLYCFKNSDLLLLSSRHSMDDQDITIRDCLMSLFPSLSDNFQPNHEICITCYEHLVTTLHFFKMTLTVEGLLNTVLKDQPFIFNEETVALEREEELEKGDKNTPQSCLNNSFFSDLENNHEDSAIIEPNFNEAPYSLLNKFEDNFATHMDSKITNECYEANEIMDDLKDQQKDVLSKVVKLLVPVKSANDLVCLEASNENDKVISLRTDDFSVRNKSDFDSANGKDSHLRNIDFVNIKSDAELTIKCEESNDITDNDQYVEPIELVHVRYEDSCTPINHVNSEETYVNNDFIISNIDNDEKYSLPINTADSAVNRNPSVTELILRGQLDKTSCTYPSLTVITPPILNPEDIAADFSENLKVVSLDFNMAIEKRIIFLGGMYCGYCMKTKGACRCFKLSQRPVICEKCGKKFTGSALKKHALTCNSDLCFTCEKCNATFSTQSKYESHLKKVADAPVCNYFKCKICFVKFSEEGFKEHIIEHPNYLCQNCGKSYISYKKLYSHVRNHHPDPNQEATVVCQFCGKLVSTKGLSLKQHLKAHDLHKQGKKETCDICNKKFYTKWDLRKHKRIHSGNKYSCDLCDKKFSSPLGVKVHSQVVHMKKPLATCEICHKEFTRRDYYRFHMRRHHAGNGPPMATSTRVPGGRKGKTRKNPSSRHKCRLCNMTFQCASNRDRHEKLHENPYYEFSCKICHTRNKSEKQLREHMKKSHSKKPNKIYQCQQCSTQFNKKYFLLHHMRNTHLKEPTEAKEKEDQGMKETEPSINQ